MKLREMQADELPREKLINEGVKHLSNAELLAILLHSGTKETSVLDLCRQILRTVHNNLRELGKIEIKELLEIKGIGTAKACTILAAVELGKRFQATPKLEQERIGGSKDAYNILQRHFTCLAQEEFHALYLNQAHRVILHRRISAGGVSETSADIRLILKPAILYCASGLIVAHNHPSGNLTPSQADNQVTHKIKEAANLHDIKLLDHLILAEDSYYSYADEGKM